MNSCTPRKVFQEPSYSALKTTIAARGGGGGLRYGSVCPVPHAVLCLWLNCTLYGVMLHGSTP